MVFIHFFTQTIMNETTSSLSVMKCNEDIRTLEIVDMVN
jgi:hypothetical protein